MLPLTQDQRTSLINTHAKCVQKQPNGDRNAYNVIVVSNGTMYTV